MCFKEQQMFSTSENDGKIIKEKNKILNKKKSVRTREIIKKTLEVVTPSISRHLESL